MALLVKLIGAKRCIELGTYTGYSALAVALALPTDGTVIAGDVSTEWTAVGQPFWRKAGVETHKSAGVSAFFRLLGAVVDCMPR